MSERIGDWTVRDDDERPARPDGRCFYCVEPIGGRHKADCVIPQRWARVRFTVEIDVAVPDHWTDEDVRFRYNDSTWCADNLVDLLEEAVERLEPQGRCLCNDVTAEPVGLEVTPLEET